MTQTDSGKRAASDSDGGIVRQNDAQQTGESASHSAVARSDGVAAVHGSSVARVVNSRRLAPLRRSDRCRAPCGWIR